MLISAAIIVRDEEGIVQRCLDCVSLFADEIVVVDTGSVDGTKEIAGRHPKVRLFDSDHFGPWTHYSEFSFSVAKNEALRRCEGDWVVWWDADDFVDEGNAARIRRLAEETDEPCLFSFLVTFGPLRFEHCRMFRNGHGILFDETHSVHEYLNTMGFPNRARREVQIQHLPGKKAVPSVERNIAIMEMDYYERGMDDPRTCFYLANGYREAGRLEEAVDFYRKYLEKSEWGEERYFARYFMSQALVELERYGEARKEAFRACAEDYRFAEAHVMLGDLAFREKDYKRAQSWYMLAADTPVPESAKLFVTPALYGPYPSARVKDCHKALVGGAPKLDGLLGMPSGKGVAGVFELPPEPEEAITAGAVLAAIANLDGGVFKVVVGDRPEVRALVDGSAGLEPFEGNGAVSLILPPNLNGRSREEWYGRAAGHVPKDWAPIVQEARKVADEARRALNAD